MNTTDHTSTIALITGGTQGLGLAVADELVASGCRQIVLAGRSKEKGAAAQARLEAAGAEVYFHSCDISIARRMRSHARGLPINNLALSMRC